MNFCNMIFARMNPPHAGHELIIDRSSEQRKTFLFLSRSFDTNKNPVPFELKIKSIKDAFKQCNNQLEIIDEENVKNPYIAIDFLKDLGYNHINVVCGQDRRASYEKFAQVFPNLTVETFQRDSTSISSSLMRNYARNNEFNLFFNNSISKMSSDYIELLYNKIKELS